MKFNYLGWLLPVVFLSCAGEPATLTSTQLERTEGQCPDACAEVHISYPTVSAGSAALTDSVQRWANQVVRDYSVSMEEETTAAMSMEQAATAFIDLWKMEDHTVSYTFEVRDSVLENTPDYVTLQLSGYIFSGGAHPNSFKELAVFETTSGKRILPAAYIQDTQKILPMLDIAYRAEKKEAFDSGFEYDGGQITFPVQVAFTEKGVLFHYNTYEIGPYILGDASVFLTWTDLEGAAKHPFGVKK